MHSRRWLPLACRLAFRTIPNTPGNSSNSGHLFCWGIQATRSSSSNIATALRSRKAKSVRNTVQRFVDAQRVLTTGGRGGDGAISFLHLWANENAGPDGGDGGNGGHVVFQACTSIKDLSHLTSILTAEAGEKGGNKDCHGKSAPHLVVKVPVGTIVKSAEGRVVGDLHTQNTMFVAARGGGGGHGNHFFAVPEEQAPRVAEFGAEGESRGYLLELRAVAHVGLLGAPNAGKSTLLRAVTRARPKVASYPFTTLRPHVGMVHYDDHQQVAVADLPGLIPGSHLNRGLGVAFLKHAERCAALLFVVDASLPEPWVQLNSLAFELAQFSDELGTRPRLVVANKIDVPGAEENVAELRRRTDLPVIAISAKMGTNLSSLLSHIKRIYDESLGLDEEES